MSNLYYPSPLTNRESFISTFGPLLGVSHRPEMISSKLSSTKNNPISQNTDADDFCQHIIFTNDFDE